MDRCALLAARSAWVSIRRQVAKTHVSAGATAWEMEGRRRLLLSRIGHQLMAAPLRPSGDSLGYYPSWEVVCR
jgi:hypothetical protein